MKRRRRKKYKREDEYHSYASWYFYYRWNKHVWNNYWQALAAGQHPTDAYDLEFEQHFQKQIINALSDQLLTP